MTAILPAPKFHFYPSDGNQVIAGQIKTITAFNKARPLEEEEEEEEEEKTFKGTLLRRLNFSSA